MNLKQTICNSLLILLLATLAEPCEPATALAEISSATAAGEQIPAATPTEPCEPAAVPAEISSASASGDQVAAATPTETRQPKPTFPPAEIKDTTAFRNQVLEASRPVLLEFYLPSCKECRKLDPTLRWLMNKYGGQVDFYRINARTKFGKDRAGKSDVSTYPTVLIFNDGKNSRRWVKSHARDSYGKALDSALE